MVATAEVTVITGKTAVHIPLNGDVRTVADVLREANIKEDATVRVNTKLVTDYSHQLEGGETVTAFLTKTVAQAGVKGARKSA